MREYFHNIYASIRTILIGMRITLRYQFAKTVTVQYPDVAPVLQPRYRGFHWFEIEKCIACDMCAKACPVDCIYIEKTGPRKIDKESGVAKGGAMTRYAIDYSKCMFCALCVPPCPTDCIHMGNLHDMSGYDRDSMIVEFTELAKEGLQTPQPLWMRKDNLPDWAQKRRQEWQESGAPKRGVMLEALEESKPPEKPKPAAAKPAPKTAIEKPAPKAAEKPADAPPTGGGAATATLDKPAPPAKPQPEDGGESQKEAKE